MIDHVKKKFINKLFILNFFFSSFTSIFYLNMEITGWRRKKKQKTGKKDTLKHNLDTMTSYTTYKMGDFS